MREVVGTDNLKDFSKMRLPQELLSQIRDVVKAYAVLHGSSFKTLSRQLWTSYGIFMSLKLFLTPFEILQLQALNQFFYEHAISRVQSKLLHSFAKPVDTNFLVWMYSRKFTDKIALVDKDLNCLWLQNSQFDFQNKHII